MNSDISKTANAYSSSAEEVVAQMQSLQAQVKETQDDADAAGQATRSLAEAITGLQSKVHRYWAEEQRLSL